MKLNDVRDRLERLSADRSLRQSVAIVEAFITSRQKETVVGQPPVLFFNASSRIHRLSINSAISLIASWKIRLEGIPAKYIVCERGMQQCILGTNRWDYLSPPPCDHCMKFSDLLFPQADSIALTLDHAIVRKVAAEVGILSLQELSEWEFQDVPVGELCLPGLRWALRRFHLIEDKGTIFLFRQYLASAASLVERFGKLFDELQPRALVVFNGLMYPEAIARHMAQLKDISVFTHEVGLRPFSAFFSAEHATFRTFDLAHDFQMDFEQQEQLDRYLYDRYDGRSEMAGIQFWPEMSSLSEELKQAMEAYSQTVAIFTNVIFDTSQVHANTIYSDMFAWLEDIKAQILEHPETMFIVRAHPDEDRPGKESQESVADWIRASKLEEWDNVIFLRPSDSTSSYQLIERSKFIMVYNSSIGLEASIMGVPVLCAGRARYTQLPIVFFPRDRAAYAAKFEELLQEEAINHPREFVENARHFLYYELFRSSLDLSEFLEPYPRAKGMVRLRKFDPQRLLNSQALAVISQGILEGESFFYPN